MDVKEINTYVFHVSQVCVDIKLAPQYPGFVRRTNFHSDNTVCIEFGGYNIDRGEGWEFCCTFPSLDQAISSVEDYLGLPINRWVNHTKTGDYPELPDFDPHDYILQAQENLIRDIFNNRVPLPGIGNFKLKGEMPYQSFEDYLEFCRQLKSELPPIEE